MDSTHICSPFEKATQSLQIRTADTKYEVDLLRSRLNKEHYLQAGRPVGQTIWQGIYKKDADEGWPKKRTF
jgi:hypothetical protein